MQSAAHRTPIEKSDYGDIEVELTQMVFRNVLVTMTLAMVAVAGTTSLLAHLYNDPRLWYFNAAMTAISLTRVGIIAAFNSRSRVSLAPRSARHWIAVYSAMTVVSFTATAAFTIYNFGHHDGTGREFSAVGTFILCGGLSGRLSARPWVDQTAGFIVMGGLFVGVARSGERFAWVVCLMLVMFLYGHCVAVRNRFDITVEQLRSRRKLRDLANRDVLTGIANRRSFESSLRQLCAYPGSFAVLFFDLDGFKKVNDTLGHAIGDILLEQVARRLQGIVRDSDLIARLGGDEFAILQTPGATEITAATLAKRVIEAVSSTFEIEGHSVDVGASIGIQLSCPDGPNDPGTLLSEADEALYFVKQKGKGDFRFAARNETPSDRHMENGPKLLRVSTGCA